MNKIMVVDDNMANLIMAKKTLEDLYEVIPVSSGISALECLKDMPEPPDLVLLDVDMPNVNGFQVISEMKNVKKLMDIPIIFLTAQDDDTTELESYNLGCIDYIKKPYTSLMLRKRVDLQIQLMEQNKLLKSNAESLNGAVQSKDKKFIELQYGIVESFVEILGRRDSGQAEHAKRTEKMMEAFTAEIVRSGKYEVNADDIALMNYASKIHDVGNLSIKDSVLAIPYIPLEEPDAIKMHTLYGAEALVKIVNNQTNNTFFKFAYNMARSHHEKWDGTGYPDRLMREKIPFEARVLAIVNTYDLFRTKVIQVRPYTHQEAMVRISTMKGTYFEPLLVDLFIKTANEIEKAFMTK